MSVGALLAEARAAAGRELADIARETRVPLRHLMAIEADDHQALPALPYALGFVKSFARALGLEAEAVAAQFRAETSLAPHVPSPAPLAPMDEGRLPSRSLAWGSLAALAIVVVGLGLYGSGVFDPPPPSPAVVASPDNGAAPPAPATAPAPAVDPALAAGDPAALPNAAVPNAAIPNATLPGAAIAPAPTAAAPARTAIPTAGPVVLLAREDVWVKIYDRVTRRRAFMGVLSAGQRFDVPAGSDLVLRAGKAGVIEVSVAGVKLPPLGGPVATIDGVVLTAPALAARFDPAAPPPPPPVRRPRLRVQPQAIPAPARAAPATPPPPEGRPQVTGA